MLVVLQATSDYSRPQRLQLRANQVAKVGRSEWADFCFGGDSAMSDVQFEIRTSAEECTVRALSKETPTRVNGQEIQSVTVHDGDQIEAGETRFKVLIEGERVPARVQTVAEPPAEPAPAPLAAAAATALSLAAVCAYLEFGDDVNELAAKASSPDKLIDQLANQGKFQDALRLRAHLLKKRQAVWWGCLCVRNELDKPLPAPQIGPLKAAEAWVAKPDEKHRRAAEQQAQSAKFSGIGATLALSAFWSEGSLAPEGNPEVPADERLTSQGVAAALITAAYHGDPTKSTDRFEVFLAKGQEMAAGKIPLPEAAAAS
jgi:hypothetical protein